jgi:hypothetical protein
MVVQGPIWLQQRKTANLFQSRSTRIFLTFGCYIDRIPFSQTVYTGQWNGEKSLVFSSRRQTSITA